MKKQFLDIDQALMDKYLIMNEDFLTHNKKLPIMINFELMNTDKDYFHYRIKCYGLNLKQINYLKKNGFTIKSINCIQGYKIGLPSNEKIWYSHISLSLKWKITI